MAGLGVERWLPLVYQILGGGLFFLLSFKLSCHGAFILYLVIIVGLSELPTDAQWGMGSHIKEWKEKEKEKSQRIGGRKQEIVKLSFDLKE